MRRADPQAPSSTEDLVGIVCDSSDLGMEVILMQPSFSAGGKLDGGLTSIGPQ